MLICSQHNTLSFIREYKTLNGYAPSFSEIANSLGIKSRGVVHRYVHALADIGYNNQIPGRQRNIQLRNESESVTIPFLGLIAA